VDVCVCVGFVIYGLLIVVWVFRNMCTCVYCVLCCRTVFLCCFVYVYLIFICFSCTNVRTTATG
jgi:hypothetical protein